MKRFFSAFLMLAFVFIYLQNAYAGVLAGIEDINNGRTNLNNLKFREAENFETGIGAAVNYLLTGNEIIGQTVKIEILRTTLKAVESLPEAHLSVDDVSSLNMYESLVMYDIISPQNLFTKEEKAGLGKSFKSILSHYMSLEICNWSDNYWCLGISAMRIVASCALYALNFPEDQDSDDYLRHSQLYFEKNLINSIDDYGAWVTDSPGYVDTAVEYMIVTAKALRNSGFQNYFANPRLKNLLLYEMNLLPPQQCPLVRSASVISDFNQSNQRDTAVIASADIYNYYPNEASYLIWYWNQCGNPLHPLGILFIDTSIPYMIPDGKSTLAGGGIAVLRDKFATIQESDVFVNFDSAYGIYNREGHNHSDSGNFSFLWSGNPLLVYDGFNNYGCAENMMNESAWRNNLVLYEGAGDTPVVPENIYMNKPVKPDITGNGTTPADFYPDGISQFISTDMVDYVSGPVRLAKSDLPASSHYRHFLFLKPDALLIWDQVESAFPLEWNLWMPVENVQTDNNVLKVYTNNNVELNVVFAGDSNVDFEIEKPPEQKNWNWPFVMRSEYGSGSITLLLADFAGQSLTDSSIFSLNVLQNIIFQYGEPEVIGLIGGNSELKEILKHFKTDFEYIEPGTLDNIDISKYSMLLIDDISSGLWESDLYNHIWKINKYISDGGNAVWICRSHSGHMSGDISGPGFIPVTVANSGCSIEILDGIDPKKDIIINEDPVWLKPNFITSESWADWISKISLKSDENNPESGLSIYTPAAWSDSWKVLASVKKSFPLKTYSNNMLEEPSRIRVRHSESKDFFTLLLPRKIGMPYSFNVIRDEPGFVSFANPVTTWEVKAGKTTWTDANLSVKISTENGFETLYAFDCTYITLESEKINSKLPMSIYYSQKDDSGIILTASENEIKYSKGTMNLHAGEIYFYNLNSSLSLRRQIFITNLHVSEDNGMPVKWAQVYVDGSFIGSTDKDGIITIRWKGHQPEAVVRYRGSESSGVLTPGEMRVIITPG